MDYLGIDIIKRTSVIAHYFEDKFQKEFTIQNNKNGYNQLLKYLKNLINLNLYLNLPVCIQEV